MTENILRLSGGTLPANTWVGQSVTLQITGFVSCIKAEVIDATRLGSSGPRIDYLPGSTVVEVVVTEIDAAEGRNQ